VAFLYLYHTGNAAHYKVHHYACGRWLFIKASKTGTMALHATSYQVWPALIRFTLFAGILLAKNVLGENTVLPLFFVLAIWSAVDFAMGRKKQKAAA